MDQSKFAVKNAEQNSDVAVLERGERRVSTASGGNPSLREPSATLDSRFSGTQSNTFERLATPPPKDNWDKIAALAPIISAALIFLTGSYCTYTYNQEQIRIQQCQTIEKFIPHLMGNEQSKKAAIMALSTLINTETAGKIASIFASTGTVSALQSLSQSGTEKDKSIATQALSTALQNLAERESKLSTIEQDYKQALAEKTKQSNDQRDTPYNLNKLAQLYIIKGQYPLAEPLLNRSLEIRERVYGPDHPEVVDALKSLAELYQLSGKSELAETTLKRAREIEEKQGFNSASRPEHAVVSPSNENGSKAPAAEQPVKSEPEKSQPSAPSAEPRNGDLSVDQPKVESKQ